MRVVAENLRKEIAMKKILLTTALMLGVAAPALADETRLGFHADTREVGGLDINTYGLMLEGHQNDFTYDAFLGTGDIEGVGMDVFSGKVLWTPWHVSHAVSVGPALSYENISIDGLGDTDMKWVGVGMVTEMGPYFMHADLMGEVDNFDEDFTLSVGLDQRLNHDWTLTSDVRYMEFGANDMTEIKTGARYNFSESVYGNFGVSANRTNGDDGVGAFAGIGMRF